MQPDKIMIRKISVENRKNAPSGNVMRQNPSFNGLGDLAVKLVQKCEQQPMVNVSVLDLSTAIIPRTIVETCAGSKKKDENGNDKREFNIYAGLEALRRESSGLIVNCLIPSFIVMGTAMMLQKPIMKGFGKANLSNVWANEESLKVVEKYLTNAKGSGSQKLENALKAFMNDLSGVDVNVKKRFVGKNSDEIFAGIKDIAASYESKQHKKIFNKGYEKIVNSSRMSEHLMLKGRKGYLSKNLKGYLEDFVQVHKAFENEGIKTAEQASKYISKAVKLVNAKSLAGLGLIIPLAVSMQPLNRWITRKASGKRGAPIYNDFADRKEEKILTPKEKAELAAQKIISIGSMLGVMGLSMFLDRPSLKNIFQFKGLFPTMDQARIISTSTFASRMAASEDKNELREATVRDIATFSSFYFLGDYVAKAIATLIQKNNKDVHLINVLKERKANANTFEKFWHWAKHTAIKSSDELTSVKDKRFRTICQLGNMAFSLLALGLFIPLYTRTQTNKRHAAELAKMKSDTTKPSGQTEFSQSLVKQNTTFKSFFNS